MSDQGSPREEEEEEEQDDTQQQPDDDEQGQGDEDNDEQNAAADEEQQPIDAAVATPAEPSSNGGGSGVTVADEKPEEESKQHDDEDVARAPTRSDSRQHQQQQPDGGDDRGVGGDEQEGDLRAAAAEQLEELEEPEAQTDSQGSQTTQQQQQSQSQQAGGGDDGDNDGAYPNSVGADSAPASGQPQRQVYDDDGGAEPDNNNDDQRQREEQQQQQEEEDPSAADYDGADRGQFDQQQQQQRDSGAADDAAEQAPYVMPDILRVVINREELELEAEEEEERELASGGGARAASERTPEQVVFVQVIKDNLHHPKPFLGGFRHKYYGTIYHHGSTQTARKKKKVDVPKFHRETQTIQIISRSQQTNREAGTQMERSDLYKDHSNDTVILSRPYFTADELESLRDSKAKEIQCFLRQCFAWRRVRRLRESKAEQVSGEVAEAEALRAREAADHAAQIQRRMHPRTRADFAVLFAELEAWRLHETQRIKDSPGLSADDVAVALQELLNKEVKLLQTIDRLKTTAARENKWAKTQSSLESMASPKEWCSSEGDLIEVETPFTTRAKELVDLYNGLCLRGLARPQRVDVLLHVKYTVKEFDCELSREIVELIKREEDLLRRQRSEQSLEGCRKRLQNLFLHFVNTPTFNPEAANFQRVAEPPAASVAPPPALSSSLAKPAMLMKTNTISAPSNVAGRIFADKSK